MAALPHARFSYAMAPRLRVNRSDLGRCCESTACRADGVWKARAGLLAAALAGIGFYVALGSQIPSNQNDSSAGQIEAAQTASRRTNHE